MAYYIFIKTLRSLEEFRKNPHIKIHPKSHPRNFQSLGIFKNPNFILKRIFLQLLAQSAQQQPTQPSSSLTAPTEHRLLLSRHRAMNAAPSFSRGMEPQRSPPTITPPLFNRL
jgi:hypothetical protein